MMMRSPLLYTGVFSLGLHLTIITALLSLGVAPEHKNPLPVISYVDLRQLWFPEKQRTKTDPLPPQPAQSTLQKKELETEVKPSSPTQPNSLSQKKPVLVQIKPPIPSPAELEPQQALPKSLILSDNIAIAPVAAAAAPSSGNGKSEELLLSKKGDIAVADSTAHTMRPVRLEATPIIAENSPPIYPRTARRRSWEGEVLLLVQVNKSGQVLKAQINRSSGHNILDQAALKAVRNWHFHAARLNDQLVKTEVIVPIQFEIQQ